jgi:hypothetical protein
MFVDGFKFKDHPRYLAVAAAKLTDINKNSGIFWPIIVRFAFFMMWK